MVLSKYYHCKIQQGTIGYPEAPAYDKPIEKWGNYKKLSGYVDIVAYGKDIDKRWRLVVPYFGNEAEFNEGDLLYLDGIVPDASKENGEGANAVVTSVNRGHKAIVIELESIIPIVNPRYY